MPVPSLDVIGRSFGLGERDLTALLAVARIRRFDSRTILLDEGESTVDVEFIVEGWACQQKIMHDGRRQILAILLPGDIVNLQADPDAPLDYAVVALTKITLARVSKWQWAQLTTQRAGLAQIEGQHTNRTNALYEQLAHSLGWRTGKERIGHLLCEISHRLCSRERSEIAFPLTQIDFADMLGMTAIHLNRLLQQMRSDGLIVLRNRLLWITDLAALERLSHFDPAYLSGFDAASEAPVPEKVAVGQSY